MNYQDICKNVILISKEVGEWMKMERQNFSEDLVDSKTFNNLVSYVDKTAEKRIITALAKLLPEADVLGEEGIDNHDSSSTYRWIIDPLDGTTNYIHGIPKYCTSIALQKNQKTVVGVIYEPNSQECFSAWKGGGAYLNGQLIKVSSSESLGTSLLATGFPYDYFDALDGYMELLKHLMKNCRGIRRIGAAALDLCYVACGRFDAFFEMALQPWDVAAGSLIVEEAGGFNSDFNGTDNYIFGQTILSSNTQVHDEIKELIKNYVL